MINEHKMKLEKNEEKDSDLLFTLLKAQYESADIEKMTDQQLRDEVMTIFLAGHETTANALGHFICYQNILQLMQDFKKRFIQFLIIKQIYHMMIFRN
jgi:hypothetical protein